MRHMGKQYQKQRHAHIPVDRPKRRVKTITKYPQESPYERCTRLLETGRSRNRLSLSAAHYMDDTYRRFTTTIEAIYHTIRTERTNPDRRIDYPLPIDPVIRRHIHRYFQLRGFDVPPTRDDNMLVIRW